MKTMILRYLPPPFLPLVQRIEASSIASRLAHGTFWSLVGTVFARGLSVLASIVVARQLGREEFGALGIIQSTVLNISIFVSYALGMTATKHIAEFRSGDPEKAGRILSLSGFTAAFAGAVLAGSLAVGAPILAERTLAAPQLTGLLRVGSLYLFLTALNGAQTGALAGFEAFRSIARMNLIVGIVTFVCMVGGVVASGLAGAVWGLVASTAVGWLVGHRAVRREAVRFGVPLSWHGICREMPILKSFSLPAILASALYGPVGWVCSAMLVNEHNGYAQMGVFNATNQWFAMVMFLPGLLGQVILPMLAESSGAGNGRRSLRIIQLTFLANAIVVVPLVLLASLVSPWLMSLYGADFGSEWPVLVLSLVTAGILAVQTPLSQAFNAEGRVWTAFFLNLGWAAAFIVLNVLMIKWGARGLVSARLLAYLLQMLFMVLLFIRLPSCRRGAVESAV
ncbi:oligosaccharide flippase family protein [Geobacter pickeringii]|uniref:oligosaccharide flippase family protein n=1 Tax=Geobacter pickeringii TaxID=345632 RepID=UPI000691B4D0|nr:oligosaccharide flippase family protein [Geobacter pickeringii]